MAVHKSCSCAACCSGGPAAAGPAAVCSVHAAGPPAAFPYQVLQADGGRSTLGYDRAMQLLQKSPFLLDKPQHSSDVVPQAIAASSWEHPQDVKLLQALYLSGRLQHKSNPRRLPALCATGDGGDPLGAPTGRAAPNRRCASRWCYLLDRCHCRLAVDLICCLGSCRGICC